LSFTTGILSRLESSSDGRWSGGIPFTLGNDTPSAVHESGLVEDDGDFVVVGDEAAFGLVPAGRTQVN